MKKLQALKNSKKGFTLIEVIVVIAIIAILAAIAIPTMGGFISKANEAQVLTEARAVYVAAQAEAASGATTLAVDVAADVNAINDWVGDTYVKLNAAEGTDGYFTVTITGGKVTALTYTDGTYTATYNGTTFTTSKNS